MYRFIIKVLLFTLLCHFVATNLVIRSKRQVEREGYNNESWVVFDGNKNHEPEFDSSESNDGDTDTVEVDFDKDGGIVSFGGRFPMFRPYDFQSSFQNWMRQSFDLMTRRFEEMTRRMYQNFNETSSRFPNNYNDTTEEIVTIGGKQFIKRQHVIKKNNEHTSIFLSSTTYEPVDDKTNES